MAWTSKDFIKELQDVEKLLALKSAPALQESLLVALLKKIDCSTNLLASDYVSMLEAITKSSLEDTKKQWLQDKIMERAAEGGEGSKGSKIVKSPQSLVNVPAYLTEAEIQQLLTGEITKAPHLIVQRLRLLGLTSIKEDTKRYCVALLVQSMLWHGMQMPDGDYTYMLATQFTSLFQASKIQSKVAPLKVYPELPTDLGQDWLGKVYGEEKPSLKTLPQLPEIASQVCVRSTNSNLSKNSRTRLQGKQSSSAHGFPADFMQALGDLVHKPLAEPSASSAQGMKLTFFNQQASPKKALPSSVSALDIMKEKQQMGQASSPPKRALALTNEPGKNGKPLDQENVNQEKNNEESNDVTMDDSQTKPKEKKGLEDYEKEAMAILLKRPASAKMSAPRTSMKRPAAKPASGENKGSSTSKSSASKKKILGCLRCRGSAAGCETCRNPTFKGQRFHGRADYLNWKKDQAKRGKIYK